MFEVETKYPIAIDSPDTLFPFGAARDNYTSSEFVCEFTKYYESLGNKKPFYGMDLGCAGGQFIVDFVNNGNKGIGLEGCGYMKKCVPKMFNWDTSPDVLFTCDVSKPFQIYEDGNEVKFDLITAWDVMEHFKIEDINVVFDNIKKHLKPRGYFAAVICCINHHPYHQMYVNGEKGPIWWLNLFLNSGFKLDEDAVNHLRGRFPRGNEQVKLAIMLQL